MKIHKYAKYFPSMSDSEFQDLVEDIKENGLIEPITIYEDRILDGVHRFKACEIAEIEPRFIEWQDGNPLKWVISKNLHRRHLSKGQRVMVLIDAGLVDEQDEGGGDPDHRSNSDSGFSKEEAADAAGVGKGLVSQVRTVAREAPELAEEIRENKISPNLAHMIVKVRERGAEYGMQKEAEKLVAAMREDRIGHNAVRDLLGAMRVAWESGDKARVRELFGVDDPGNRTNAEQEARRQEQQRIERQAKEIEKEAKKSKATYQNLPEVKWVLDYFKAWREAIKDQVRPAMVKMSPEAMRFLAAKIELFIDELKSVAEELKDKGAV